MAQQKSVIVLVPEIALTSQLIAEFEQHFSNILLTHSQQTESARHQIWLDALQSTIPRIAIGPRSALFLPLAHIGAIVIDEAHEPSFKPLLVRIMAHPSFKVQRHHSSASITLPHTPIARSLHSHAAHKPLRRRTSTS